MDNGKVDPSSAPVHEAGSLHEMIEEFRRMKLRYVPAIPGQMGWLQCYGAVTFGRSDL